MTEYTLVPRPGGVYTLPELVYRLTIAEDLDFLLDGDAHTPDIGPFNLRADVLIERIDVPLEAAS